MQDGATVLHYAARNANSFAIKSLLRSNADINACDNVGRLYHNPSYSLHFYSRCKIISVTLVQVEKSHLRLLDVHAEGIMSTCMW